MNNIEAIENNIAKEIVEMTSHLIPAIKEHPASLYDFDPIDQLEENNDGLFWLASYADIIAELLTNGYTTEALNLLNSTANSAIITLAHNRNRNCNR